MTEETSVKDTEDRMKSVLLSASLMTLIQRQTTALL